MVEKKIFTHFARMEFSLSRENLSQKIKKY